MAKAGKGKKALRPDTQLVHGGTVRSQHGETSEALFLTQGYVYDTAEAAAARFAGDEPGFIYSRFSNPTVAMFEERMRLLEGAEAARATATGMAAVTADLPLPSQGRRPCGRGAGAFRLLPLCGRGTAAALRHRHDAGRRRRSRRVEERRSARARPRRSSSKARPTRRSRSTTSRRSPTSPTRRGARLIVDNVFATPLLQKPLELGADIVVYSATKHIDGQGRVLGGVILSDQAFVTDHLHTFLRQTGPSLSPFNAWVLLKGLETLGVRVERQTRSAALIADRLAAHRRSSASSIPAATTTRRRRSPASR